MVYSQQFITTKKNLKKQKQDVIINLAADGIKARGALSLAGAFAYLIREEVARKVKIKPGPEINAASSETIELITCHVLLMSKSLESFQLWSIDVANLALGSLAINDNKELYRFLCMKDFALRATPRELAAVTRMRESVFYTLNKNRDFALSYGRGGPNPWDSYEIIKILGGPDGSLNDALPELDGSHKYLLTTTYDKASKDFFSLAAYVANEMRAKA